MEHLALEIFDLGGGTGSKFANLPENASITITDTSEIFASGDVWSHSFTLNIPANAHIFGTSGEIHGSRLHEQINKRRARLWVEGLPLFLGYLKLDDEVDVGENGDVDVTLESGQKTFEEMIEGTKAREVSVGDVVIGVALNRKRVVKMMSPSGLCRLDGLEAYAAKDSRLEEAAKAVYVFSCQLPGVEVMTPYVQRWPKLMKSQGKVCSVQNGVWTEENKDYTNVQTPYDAAHPFCNINICYPFKAVDAAGEEKEGRGYTKRLAHGKATTDGGDEQTRYNNSPNFYLLYFIDRLFKDLKIHIMENQAKDVEDLRRVFMLNYGCHYEEIENNDYDSPSHLTQTAGSLTRYGQYYLPLIDDNSVKYILNGWDKACMQIQADSDIIGKVLMRDVEVTDGGVTLLQVGSIEGKVIEFHSNIDWFHTDRQLTLSLSKESVEETHNAYSAYLAYATGDNYPNVDISEIIESMKSMFGIRLLFNNDFSTVRIVLLRNIFRNNDVQTINCEIVDDDVKVENCIRGFRMTYGKGTEDTNFYYKGFSDMFPRAATTWKNTTDKHDYSRWELNADYGSIKQYVSAMNRTCYVTPVNGNAYAVKVDEDEDVLFPSLLEVAGFMDAEDGDCTGEEGTIKEIQIGATPVIMNEIGPIYASLFSGDMKAPSPDNYEHAQKIATFGRITLSSLDTTLLGSNSQTHQGISVNGKLDVYISEGFQIRMMDNYSIGNSGTPFDDADPGLCFGIMRGSGSDSRIAYYEDEKENETPCNDYWEVVPGGGAIDHSDICDGQGNLWDYNGDASGVGQTSERVSLKLRAEKPNPLYKSSTVQPYSMTVTNRSEAGQAMTAIFTTSNADLLNRKRVSGNTMRAAGWTDFSASDYATVYSIQRSVQVKGGIVVEILWTPIRPDGTVLSPTEFNAYVAKLGGPYVTADVVRLADAAWEKLILDMYTTEARAVLLNDLQAIYYAEEGETIEPVVISSSTTANSDDRYLEITTPNLRGRGLCDQFYKEYSYWIRNARILKRTVRMTLAQLLTIDKTKRVTVGDVTGFIRKMLYSVSNKTGLGEVTMEIMYI